MGKVPPAKPDDPNSIPRTYMLKERTDFHKLSSDLHTYVYTHTHTQM